MNYGRMLDVGFRLSVRNSMRSSPIDENQHPLRRKAHVKKTSNI